MTKITRLSFLGRAGLVLCALSLACSGLTGAATASASPSQGRPVGAVLGSLAKKGVVGTKSRPAVENCGLGSPELRPSSLYVACADGNAEAVHLRWKTWGPHSALAVGTFTWNTCVPYCAASRKWDSVAARFTLEMPVKTSAGWLFERLTGRLTGKAPAHMERVFTISEKPVPR